MEVPLISVIVPVYSVEAYLDRCVQSIVDQTFLRCILFAGHIQLVRADDQLIAAQLFFLGRWSKNVQLQIALAQEVHNICMVGLHQCISLFFRTIHGPAAAALGSCGHIKFRTGQKRVNLCYIVCTHLGPYRLDLLTLKGGVINQGQCINANVHALGNLLHRAAFGPPGDLGISTAAF